MLAGGRVVAGGAAERVLTSGNVTAAFGHPIGVERRDGRWSARAARPAPLLEAAPPVVV